MAAVAVGGTFGYCALNDDVPEWCNTLVNIGTALLVAGIDDDDDDEWNRPNQGYYGNQGFGNQWNYENFEFDD